MISLRFKTCRFLVLFCVYACNSNYLLIILSIFMYIYIYYMYKERAH